MKKRLFAVLLISVMLCFLGCSRKKDREASLPYDNLKPEPLPPIELQIFTQGTVPNYAQDFIQDMLKHIEIETKDTINVIPCFNWAGYDIYDTIISMKVASDDKIDAFTCSSPKAYVEQGLCIDLTALFKNYAPAYYQELMTNEMGKDYLANCAIEGKLYAIPYNGVQNPRVCVVTKADLAAKYAPNGMETLEDYGDFLKKVKENESGVVPGIVYAYDFFQAYMEGNGYHSFTGNLLYSRWDQKGSSIYPIEKTPEFNDAFELIKLWKIQGYILRSTVMANQYHISSKNLASILYPMNQLGEIFTFAQPINNVQFKVIPLYMQSLHLISSTARGVAVTEKCRYPERVVMFLEWLHGSQEKYDMFMYGQEGIHYTMKDGNIVIKPDISNQIAFWKMFGTEFFQDYRYERFTTNLGEDIRQIYLDSSFTNVMTSIEFREKVSEGKDVNITVMDKLEAENPQISTIMNAYYDNFGRFIKTIDSGLLDMTLDELNEKQKQAGIEKVIELYQRAMSE
mgnify:CR=1 FL=1